MQGAVTHAKPSLWVNFSYDSLRIKLWPIEGGRLFTLSKTRVQGAGGFEADWYHGLSTSPFVIGPVKRQVRSGAFLRGKANPRRPCSSGRSAAGPLAVEQVVCLELEDVKQTCNLAESNHGAPRRLSSAERNLDGIAGFAITGRGKEGGSTAAATAISSSSS